MFKNVAAKFIVFCFDATTNVPKTGDAANITAYVSKDYGAVTVLGDTSATEMDATNAPGYYLFDAAQAETNGDCLMVSGKSSTANIKVIGAPAVIYTRPTTGWLAPATAGRTLVVDAAGLADANMVKAGPTGSGAAQTAGDIIGDTNDIQSRLPAGLSINGAMSSEVLYWGGGVVPVPSITGVPKVDPTHWLGTAILAPPVAGIPTVNVKTWNNLTTVALPLIPTVAGRTLDCSAGGEAGVDWANVGTPGSAVNLSATTVNLANTVTTYAGNTPQTGDAYLRLGAPAGATTAADIAAVKVDTAAVKVTTDKFVFTVANQVDCNVVTKTGFSLLASGLDLVVISDLAGVPTATAKVVDAIAFQFMSLRNLRTTTATADTVANNAGATIGTATVSDDGTTFSKTKYT